MGVRVPLAVPIRPRRRDQPVERAFDVAGDIRIRAFIDGDRRRRMRHIQIANASGNTGRSDRLLHLRRHIHKLRPAIGFHAQCLHLRASRQRADSSMQQIRSAAEAFFFSCRGAACCAQSGKASQAGHSERSEDSFLSARFLRGESAFSSSHTREYE